MFYKKFLPAIMLFTVILSGCVSPAESSSQTQNNSSEPQKSVSSNYNNITNYLIQADGEYTYLANYHSICCGTVGSNDYEEIFTDENINMYKIAVTDDKIFFSSVNRLYSIDKNGENPTYLAQLTDLDSGINWTDFYIYKNEIYLEDLDKNTVKLLSFEPDMSVSDSIKRLYCTADGKEYEYLDNTELGDGKLHLIDSDIYAPQNDIICGSLYFILTDNYVYYVTGTKNDFSADLQIKRCDFNGENTETIAEFNNNVYFSNYDEKYVYFHDDNSYYLIDIVENKIVETPVTYQSGRGYEICNGKLYNLLTLEPTVTDFSTGKTELLSLHHT